MLEKRITLYFLSIWRKRKLRKNRRKVFLLREKPLEKGAFRTYERERKGNKKILTAKKGLEERKGDGKRERERENPKASV